MQIKVEVLLLFFNGCRDSGSDLAQRGPCRPAGMWGGPARAGPAGTSQPRHTESAPPAAPRLKSNTPQSG